MKFRPIFGNLLVLFTVYVITLNAGPKTAVKVIQGHQRTSVIII